MKVLLPEDEQTFQDEYVVKFIVWFVFHAGGGGGGEGEVDSL